jgi:hypothetical protein
MCRKPCSKHYQGLRRERAATIVCRPRLIGRIGRLDDPVLCWLRNLAFKATPSRVYARQVGELCGIYERLLEERAEEEQHGGESLPKVRDLESKVLVKRLEDSKVRSRYAANLSTMHRLISRGPRNAREGMRLGSLKARATVAVTPPRPDRPSTCGACDPH